MSTNEVRSNDAARNAGVARIDMKLELVLIPVSDIDSAKELYARIGWRLNADRSPSEDFRLVQFTPPGSWCSVHFHHCCRTPWQDACSYALKSRGDEGL